MPCGAVVRMIVSYSSTSSNFIPNRTQQYNTVCMTNIINISDHKHYNVILPVAIREAMGLSGWQPQYHIHKAFLRFFGAVVMIIVSYYSCNLFMHMLHWYQSNKWLSGYPCASEDTLRYIGTAGR